MVQLKKATQSTSFITLPTLRDSKNGWRHLAALLYAIGAVALGLKLLARSSQTTETTASTTTTLGGWVMGVFLSAHGRVIAAYLVHEATHANIFLESHRRRHQNGNRSANAWLGTVALWLAGCPYADWNHVQRMHLSHHHDRADTVEFDYRGFLFGQPEQEQKARSGSSWSTGVLVTAAWVFRNVVLGLEFCFVPVVETLMHTRCALHPIFHPGQVTPSRRTSARIGTPVLLGFYITLYAWGGASLLASQLVAGAVMLQYLALNDAFHHTYEAIIMANYVPGPGPRTAQYEEDNTYSNLISTQYPLVNLLSLNFGYHNAHHKRASTPWYQLPQLHHELYENKTSLTTTTGNQVLPFSDILGAWYRHRLSRVVQYDYGVVGAPGMPHRAKDFVGALGVSFLTV